MRLCELFYWEVVRPLLDRHFPGLLHSAGLIGDGSEVLGFDDPMSSDHHWGPRVMLFLRQEEYEHQAPAIREMLAHQLPCEFRGYPTNFTQPDPTDNNTQLLQPIARGPVNHRVSTHTVRGFFAEYLGWDPSQALEPADWLTFSEQRLRAVTAGALYHDDVGLGDVRARFSYYPHDVWLYLLAAGWARIGQEEHLMGRAGIVGDEIGSALIAARLVRDIMRLCFLSERTYAPYPKWFGTAFKQLSCSDDLWPILQRALTCSTWQERERYLVQAYERIATMHNALQLTETLPQRAVPFYGRPFRVIAVHGFANALLQRIRDPAVRRIAEWPPIGSIDQFSDSTDLVSTPFWRFKLRQLYD
ncbi:MAG: DUF4037 domain-containing protein [Chloroflexi bacterium]|nr:DUF4037 domain-containing protein [Chloroflexota bacterium]